MRIAKGRTGHDIPGKWIISNIQSLRIKHKGVSIQLQQVSKSEIMRMFEDLPVRNSKAEEISEKAIEFGIYYFAHDVAFNRIIIFPTPHKNFNAELVATQTVIL